jgi:hypothetical protein
MATRGRPRVKETQVQETQLTEDRPNVVETRSKRPSRVPINGYRNLLGVEGLEKGFHYCWVTEELVPRFERALYEFVTHECVVGDRSVNKGTTVGSRISIPSGNNETSYLMRVPQEYYDQDMESHHKDIDDKERMLKRQLNSQEDGRYGKVEITVNTESSS